MQGVGARPHPPPQTVGQRLLFMASIGSMAALTYAMTPLTNSLDDIKIVFLHGLLPFILAAYFALLARGEVPPAPAPLNLFLALYLGTMLISTLSSDYPWIGWQVTAMTWSSLGAYFGAVGSVRTRRDLERLMLAQSAVCFGTIVFGLLHRLKFFTLVRGLWNSDASLSADSLLHLLIVTLAQADSEMMSTILNRDFYSGYLNMFIPSALALAIATESTWVRRLSLFVVAFGAPCIVLTMSKDDYVILVLTPILFFLLYHGRIRLKPIRIRNWPVWLIGIGVVCATVIFLRWSLFANQLKFSAMAKMDGSVAGRLIIWRGSLGIFRDHPILGGGPGSYRILFPQHRDPDYHLHAISTVTNESHDLFLDYLSETGVLGFVFGVGLMATLAWMSVRVILREEDRRLRTLQAGLLCGLAALTLKNLTSPFTRWPIGSSNMYFLMGTVAAGINVSRLSAPPGTLPGWSAIFRRPGFLGTAGWAGFAVAAVAAMLCAPFGFRYFGASIAHNRAMLLKDYARSISDLRLAMQWFQKALDRNPNSLTTYYRMADVVHDLFMTKTADAEERGKQALDLYRRLQELSPDYAEVHYNLGVVNSNLADSRSDPAEKIRLMKVSVREFDEGARQSSKYLTQRNTAQAHEKLALLLAQRPDGKGFSAPGIFRDKEAIAEMEKAIASYERTLTYSSDRPDVRLPPPEGPADPHLLMTRKSYGLALQKLGRSAEAMEQLRQYLKERPGDEEASAALVWAMDSVKDYGQIENILDDLVASNPLRQEYRYDRVKLYIRMGRLKDAWAECQRALKLVPGEARTVLAAGEILIRLERYEEARPYMESLTRGALKDTEEGRKAGEMLKRMDETTSGSRILKPPSSAPSSRPAPPASRPASGPALGKLADSSPSTSKTAGVR